MLHVKLTRHVVLNISQEVKNLLFFELPAAKNKTSMTDRKSMLDRRVHVFLFAIPKLKLPCTKEISVEETSNTHHKWIMYEGFTFFLSDNSR